ncbi:putative reverse transcriptase domain-containing protein [Tanacetum coccineum]
MSDSKDSTVTCMAVSSPFIGMSDIGSPGVDGPPVIPVDPYAYVVAAFQAPPSPDYVPGPEEPEQAPLLPEFVLEPVYPEFMPPEDEEEEEEHPAPADSVPPPVHHVTAWMSIRDEPPTPFRYEAEIARLLDIPSPSPSPLSPWSSPLPQIPSPTLPVSSPVPVSPLPLPASPTYPLGYRAAMIRQRVESPSTSHSLLLPPPIILSHTRASVAMMRAVALFTYILASRSETPPSETPPLLPIPLPIPSPPLLLPFTNRRADRTEVCLPPRKRLCIALGLREIRRDPERDVGYGITDTWDEMLEGMLGAPATNETELGQRMTNFVTTVRQDTDEIYGRLDEVQEARAVLSGRLNLLGRDRRSHAYTALLMEREARLSLEAWRRSMDASDTAHSEVEALRTTVLAEQTKIVALRAADRARQAQLIEILGLMSTLQTHVTTLQGQQGPASCLAQPEIPEEAGSKNGTKRATRSTSAATTATTSMTNAQLKAMIDQGVTDALAVRDADRNTNGDGSHNLGTGVRRTERVARECTYPYFMKCQPLNFKGTEGVIELIQWLHKMENVFSIRTCSVENQIKFSTCTLLCSVVASKPKTMQEEIKIATELIDKKIRTFVERQTENKRKHDDSQQQQQQNKRQNTGRAYTAGSAPKCHKCNRVGHLAGDCRSPANTNASNNLRGTRAGQKPTCYECGAQGHFKRDCPKLKNNNRGNQGGNGNALAKVYVVGHAGTNPDSNVITGTFLLNNRYAFVLFDTGADRCFVSTAFSSQIDITPSTLDHYYDVELADGRIIGLNAIIQGCTLNFLNHTFKIDLMPVELGSLDVISGMDWLAKYQAVIVCAEKIVRIPWGNETLIVRGLICQEEGWESFRCASTTMQLNKLMVEELLSTLRGLTICLINYKDSNVYSMIDWR